MPPLATLLERAEAIYVTHGRASAAFLLQQIERAVRDGAAAAYIQELDHLLQLIEYRERVLAFGRRPD